MRGKGSFNRWAVIEGDVDSGACWLVLPFAWLALVHLESLRKVEKKKKGKSE